MIFDKKNLSLVLLLFLMGCNDEVALEKDNNSQFLLEVVNSDHSQLKFSNNLNETHQRNNFIYEYFYNGSGTAIGDINNDGLPDIFLGGNDVPDALYLNKGNLVFEDISNKAIGKTKQSWTSGVTLVDINNDGYLDIYVCKGGPYYVQESLRNELYINQGDLTFVNQAEQYGLDDPSNSLQASFFDYDNDNDLDVIISTNSDYNGITADWFKKWSSASPGQRKLLSLRLFENDNGKFKDVSIEAKVNLPSFGLGIITTDLDDDGNVDIYIANDYFLPDYYLKNQGDKTFVDVSKEKLGYTSYYSMGTDASDFNNDGILDIATVDMTPSDHYRNKVLMASMNVEQFKFLKYDLGFNEQYMFNTFQIGNGNGYYSEVGKYLKVSQTDWSWSSLLFDIDNDGFKDYFVTNGYYRDTKDNDFRSYYNKLIDSLGNDLTAEMFDLMKNNLAQNPIENKLFKNINGEKLADVSNKWTNMKPSFSNGCAYGDLDGDGDLEIVINNLGGECTLLKNNSSNNFLRVKLSDDNDNVVNARAIIYKNGLIQRVDNNFTRGYLSSMEPILHFGLGNETSVDSLIIYWNNTECSKIINPKINEVNFINKSKIKIFDNSQKIETPLFEDITSRLNPELTKHNENDFDDFNKEVLLPQKYSTLGPCLAVGDIDNDGFEDFFVGGAKNQAPKIFTQYYGEFKELKSQVLTDDAKFEDLGSVFFDADQDNDLDLYVASGGGGDLFGKEDLLQDRLYINNGKGEFTRSSLPRIITSTKSITPLDYDNDGDLDLFVGGRNNPGQYPLDATSYLLENNNGVFENKMSDDFQNSLSGMITDVSAIDIDNDNDLDLMIVGEWTEPRLYINNDGKFEKANLPNFSNLSGWWQSILAKDIDNDGDVDFVLGNIGENNKFHPSIEKPLEVLASDFDKSGTLDIVLTKHYKDKIVPVRGKECSSQQMPFINEKFPTYSEFASSSIGQILGEENLEEAIKKRVTNFSSVILINNGSLNFEIKKLPIEAQWFPIMGIIADDFDKDGNKDLLLAGNIFDTEPETPAYDTGKGIILYGDGEGDFHVNNKVPETGLLLDKNLKVLKSIKIGRNQEGIIAANNDDIIQIFVN